MAMTRPVATCSSRRWRAPALITLAAWLVIELLFLGQAMHTDAFGVWQAIHLTLPRSVIWLVFAPLAVGLAFWFPLERGRLARSLVLHLAACVLLMAASHRALSHFTGAANRGVPQPSSSSATPASPNSSGAPRPRGGPMAHIALAHLALNL